MAAAGCLLALASCTADDEPANALTVRVQRVLDDAAADIAARLDQLGADVTAAEVGDARVTCPDVEDAAVADRATCRLAVGELEVELDVEFVEDGAIRVVNVAVAP